VKFLPGKEDQQTSNPEWTSTQTTAQTPVLFSLDYSIMSLGDNDGETRTTTVYHLLILGVAMKSKRTLYALAVLGLSCSLCLTACGGDEIELPPETVELDGPTVYGTADLTIYHMIPLGIGSIETETTMPLRFPVKQGDKHLPKGEFNAMKETESHWDLAAAGMVQGASTNVIVPATYQVSGHFDSMACGFKFDLVEIMHYSQVETAEVQALGSMEVDLGADEDWTLRDVVIVDTEPEIVVEDPTVLGAFHLGISNFVLPTNMECNFN
jgi:hypothetical protein